MFKLKRGDQIRRLHCVALSALVLKLPTRV